MHRRGGLSGGALDACSLVIRRFFLTGRNWSLEQVDACMLPEASWGDRSHDRRAFQRSAGAISGPSERSVLDADGAGGMRGAAAERGTTAGGE